MAKAKQDPEPNKQEQDERQSGLMRREQYYPSMWSGSPFALMNRIADEMDRMFENFGFGRGWLAPRLGGGLGRGWGEMGQAAWSPQLEVFEREGQFIVRADLPGLTKDDVKVEITDDAVTIQGERKQEREEEKEGWHRSERSYGRFFRSIPLPEGVNADEAKASFRDGVLEIAMPAPQREERRRRIEVS